MQPQESGSNITGFVVYTGQDTVAELATVQQAAEILAPLVQHTNNSLVVAHVVNPNVLYVRSNGNDGIAQPGREDLPWETLDHAYLYASSINLTDCLFDVGCGYFDFTPPTDVDICIIGKGKRKTLIGISAQGEPAQMTATAINSILYFPTTADGGATEVYPLAALGDFYVTFAGASFYVTTNPSVTAPSEYQLVYLALDSTRAQVMTAFSDAFATYSSYNGFSVNTADGTITMQDDGNVIPYIGTENPVIQLSQIGVQAVWNNATAAKSIRLSGGFATVNINAAGGDSTTTSQGNGGNITITGSFNVGDIVSYCGQGNDPSACGGEVLLVGCDATAGFFSATASGQGVNGNIYLVHTPYDAGCVYGNVIAMESADIQNIPMNPKITL